MSIIKRRVRDWPNSGTSIRDYSGTPNSRIFPVNELQLYAPLWAADQQGFALSFDGNDKWAATVADFRSADSLGTYELTGFVSSSTANHQTLLASSDTASSTSFIKIYIRQTTGRLTIDAQNANGTANSVSGTTNVCDGKRHTFQVKSNGTAWSFIIDGVLDTPTVITGSNTGNWFADITLRDNITSGCITVVTDVHFAIAIMGQQRIYSRELSLAECATNHSRGWKADPSDQTDLVFWMKQNEGTGNPVDSVGSITGVITGATWIESLIDRSLNAYPISLFGSPVWSNQGRTLALNKYGIVTSPALNFTTSDFSAWVWVKPTNFTAQNTLLSRGLWNVDGWYFFTNSASTGVYTAQAGASQYSLSTAAIATETWHLLGFTRAGTVVKVWKNGLNVTTTSGNHVNPLTSARTLKIGAYDDLGQPFIGTMGESAIYNRALTQAEWTQIFNSTRWRYGV